MKDPSLLKALSGIAAKAKEKIKTMSDPSKSACIASGSSSISLRIKSPDSVALTREMAIASVAKAQFGEHAIAAPVRSSNKSTLKMNEFPIQGRREVVDKQAQSVAEIDVATARSSRSPVRKTTVEVRAQKDDGKKVKTSNTDKKRRSRSRS